MARVGEQLYLKLNNFGYSKCPLIIHCICGQYDLADKVHRIIRR